MGAFSFTDKLVSELMSSLGAFCDMVAPLRAPIDDVASGGKLLPSRSCVPAIIEGVFLLRNSIPKGNAYSYASMLTSTHCLLR